MPHGKIVRKSRDHHPNDEIGHGHTNRNSRASGSHHSPGSDSIDNFRLDNDVAEKLHKLEKKHHIAFLSGCEREYYPENPGHTKFALEFQAAKADPTVPPPQYYTSPFADRLNKPVSKKGYGIGGLSGPRFVKEHGLKIPAPNQYQKQVKELLTRQHRFPPQVWMNYGLLGEVGKIWDDKVARKLFSLWGKCHQINVAFGTSAKEPRFGKDKKWNIVGPGNYEVRKLTTPPPRVFNGFLRGPTVFNPPTKLHCSYGPKDHCLECDTELMGTQDYYRARFRVDPIPLRPIIEDTEEHILQAMSEQAMKEKQRELKAKSLPRRVLLCRSCYCKALRGESRFFKTRAEVHWLFEKTRHCGYIHGHNGIPEYTLNASCYWNRKLARKEAILSKHYPDKCEKRIVEKKQKYQA